MDWDDLQYFMAMHRAGSVAGAARELSVNHSTVLRRLDRLEQTLGAQLFERFASGYVLTAAGHDLAERLHGIAERIDDAQRGLQGLDFEVRGTIRITSTDTLIHGLLLPYLAEFRARHPAVRFELVMNNDFLNLTQREADIAVRGSNQPPDNLLGRRVGAIRTAPYAARRYLERRGGEPLRWSDCDWVGLDAGLQHLEQAKWLRQQVPAERIVAEVDSLVAMVGCVREGLGAGMLLCPLAQPHDDLVALADPLPELDTQVWVLVHPQLKRVARVRALADFLYEALSRDPRLDHRR
jgi:DNA-binding transcriptional LysR family regulator